jgi:YVTN family beta-propeller protein
MPCAARPAFVAAAMTLLSTPFFAPASAAPERSAYVIGANDASVARVDLISGIVMSNVATLGSVANRITADSALTVAAIVSSGSDDVRAFDLMSESVTAVVALPPGTNPWDVEIAGNEWFVTSLLHDRVLVVDPASASVIDSIDVGKGPEGLCAVAGKLYVANTGFDFSTFGWDPGSVTVIDVATRAVLETIPVALNPQECVASNEGRVHVICTGDFGTTQGAVDVIDPLADIVVATLAVPGYPGAATVADSTVWLGVTTPAFSSHILGYRAADLSWVRDASDPLLPSFDFYGNLRASATGEILVTDFTADLLLVEGPASPGTPDAYLVSDGPIDLAVVERAGPVSLALSGLSAVDTADGVRLRWLSGIGTGVRGVAIERSSPGCAGVRVADLAVSGGASEWIDRDAPFDVPLTWRVTALDGRGRIAGVAATTLVRRAPGAEARLAIRRLRPNPTRDAVSIEWVAPHAGAARIELLSVAGRRIGSMDLGVVPAGEGAARWDGRDDAGRSVGPGVFFARLTIGDDVAVARGLRLR